MAQANRRLIRALRETADRLERGANYRWTHMGSCNCGHLAQTVTRLSRAHLHRIALQKAGDWTEQARDYCPDSGLPMDDVIESILDLGLSTSDLAHLERLSGPEVLRDLPSDQRNLDHRNREHVVRYLRVWADRLERQLDPTAEPTPADVAATGVVRSAVETV
jgi:hypothetical protein